MQISRRYLSCQSGPTFSATLYNFFAQSTLCIRATLIRFMAWVGGVTRLAHDDWQPFRWIVYVTMVPAASWIFTSCQLSMSCMVGEKLWLRLCKKMLRGTVIKTELHLHCEWLYSPLLYVAVQPTISVLYIFFHFQTSWWQWWVLHLLLLFIVLNECVWSEYSMRP